MFTRLNPSVSVIGTYTGIHFCQYRFTDSLLLCISHNNITIKIVYNKSFYFYQEVIKQFPRSHRAGEALYQSAQCLYHLSKYDEAISAYQKYLQQYPRGNLSLLAGLGLGYCYEEKSEFEKAMAAYSNAIANNPNDPLLGEAFASLARCQEVTGKKDDAVKTYEQLMEKLPNSNWKFYAERKLLYLKSH